MADEASTSIAVAAQATGQSKIENLSKEELIKLVKKYTVLQKQNKAKNEELTNKLTSYESDLKKILSLENFNDFKVNLDEFPLVEEIRVKFKTYADKCATVEDENRYLNKLISERNTECENLKREIELNKSILEMLNNEIKILSNNEKQLEHANNKYPKRGSSHEDVIMEEDENDQ